MHLVAPMSVYAEGLVDENFVVGRDPLYIYDNAELSRAYCSSVTWKLTLSTGPYSASVLVMKQISSDGERTQERRVVEHVQESVIVRRSYLFLRFQEGGRHDDVRFTQHKDHIFVNQIR